MLLEMQNVVKRFGGLTAVSNMSFQVKKGEIFGVIGPNGAGKTTIFNLITGVYPVSEGNILFDGQSISGKKPYQIINGGYRPYVPEYPSFHGDDSTGEYSCRTA